MEMKQADSRTVIALAALGFVAVLAISFAAIPSAIASTQSTQSGSDYPIEIMRTQANYKVADPASVVQVGLGVHGSR